MIEILQQVQRYKRQPVSSAQFNEWKRHPVTESLLFDLTDALTREMGQELPDDPNFALPMVWRREGGHIMLQALFEWTPSNVKSKSLDGGSIEEEGEDDDQTTG